MAVDAMKLNLGAGGQVVAGWTNLDRIFTADLLASIPVTIEHDLTDRLPFKDNSVDMAVAHHVLDLVNACDLDDLLDEIFRVLKPHATLRISLFDIHRAWEAAEVRQERLWFELRGAPEGDLRFQYHWMVHQNGARRWITTPFLLGQVLESAGFIWSECAYRGTSTTDPTICDLDSREEESFYVEATKP